MEIPKIHDLWKAFSPGSISAGWTGKLEVRRAGYLRLGKNYLATLPVDSVLPAYDPNKVL